MIVAVGVDTIEIARVAGLLDRARDRFLARVFTPGERAYCLALVDPAPSLAARFCAKEAVMKCLGTGWTGGVGFAAIEVVREPSGRVAVRLHDAAADVARTRGIRTIHLSLSHDETRATAFAVAEG